MLDVGNAKLVDMAIEGVGDAAHVSCDVEGIQIELDGLRIAHLRDGRAVEVEALVVRAGVLVIGADDIAPAALPEGARDVVLQPGIGAAEEPARITTCKALVETCNVNTRFFLQWQARDHPFRARAVDAQALGRPGPPARR
jgi:hypothetical protein